MQFYLGAGTLLGLYPPALASPCFSLIVEIWQSLATMCWADGHISEMNVSNIERQTGNQAPDA